MGCGKTLQAIALIEHYQRFWPVLVLVPVSLASQWNLELRRWLPRALVKDKEIVVISKKVTVPEVGVSKLIRPCHCQCVIRTYSLETPASFLDFSN